MHRTSIVLLAALALGACRDDNPAPAEPQSTAATQEAVRRPGQAIDPVERAKGVEQEVLDARRKNDEAIAAGGG